MRSAASPACASSMRRRSRAGLTRRAWCSCARRPSDRADPARIAVGIFSATGLANRSDAVGRHLMDHVHGHRRQRARIRVSSIATTTAAAPRASTCRATSTSPKRATAISLRGCGFQGYCGAAAGIARARSRAWARSSRSGCARRVPGKCVLFGFAEMLPRADNRVTLHAAQDRLLGLAAGAHRLHASARTSAGWPSAPTRDAVQMLVAAGLRKCPRLFAHRSAAGHVRARDGHRAHGPRPRDLRAQPAQPGARRPEPLHHRRLVHDLVGLRKPLADLHGPVGPCRATTPPTGSPQARCSVFYRLTCGQHLGRRAASGPHTHDQLAISRGHGARARGSTSASAKRMRAAQAEDSAMTVILPLSRVHRFTLLASSGPNAFITATCHTDCFGRRKGTLGESWQTRRD